MQTSAKYQSVLELLEEILKKQMPADNTINTYLRARKYIGSSDRRFITENVWNIIRNFMKLEFEANSSNPRDILITYLKDEDIDTIFCGGKYGLEKLNEAEKSLLQNINENLYPDYVEAECPEWIFEQIKDIEFCKALNISAPADFRINTKNREVLIQKLSDEGFEVEPTPISPIGIRSNKRIVLNNCIAYKDGEIEVQDEASQIGTILCDVNTDHKTVDFCCGAGGKSLTISYLLKNQGKIFVHDVAKERLEHIKPRMERLGVKNIWFMPQVNDIDFNRYIIDAPCSGTGTWRRSPDSKFRLTPKYLQNLNQIQAEILENAAERIVKNGRIIYMTCSVLKCENEDIITQFLQNHPNFKSLNIKKLWESKFLTPYPCQDDLNLRLSPLTTNTDGFFVSILERI